MNGRLNNVRFHLGNAEGRMQRLKPEPLSSLWDDVPDAVRPLAKNSGAQALERQHGPVERSADLLRIVAHRAAPLNSHTSRCSADVQSSASLKCHQSSARVLPWLMATRGSPRSRARRTKR